METQILINYLSHLFIIREEQVMFCHQVSVRELSGTGLRWCSSAFPNVPALVHCNMAQAHSDCFCSSPQK